MTWVPQNDVLAHPKLKLFLTHCGVNSMYEVRASSTPAHSSHCADQAPDPYGL